MKIAVLAALLLAPPVMAETISFEADEGIMIVRGRQSGSDAVYEYIAEGKDAFQCVALGAEGKPIAVETAYGGGSLMMFSDL